MAKWGTKGSGNGQFVSPKGLAIDGLGYIYITDTGNSRIQKFDSNGNYITQWGIEGSDDGQLLYPEGIAVDGSGYVYVADTGNHRILIFGQNKVE